MKTTLRLVIIFLVVYFLTAAILVVYACPEIEPPKSTDNGSVYVPPEPEDPGEMLPPNTTNITSGPVPPDTVGMLPTT